MTKTNTQTEAQTTLSSEEEQSIRDDVASYNIMFAEGSLDADEMEDGPRDVDFEVARARREIEVKHDGTVKKFFISAIASNPKYKNVNAIMALARATYNHKKYWEVGATPNDEIEGCALVSAFFNLSQTNPEIVTVDEMTGQSKDWFTTNFSKIEMRAMFGPDHPFNELGTV